jgi:predicted Zn-dependent peptidase
MFTSRLNLNLREKHGFTYGVRSAFGFRKTGGAFVTSTAVSTDVTARAVEELMGEIVRMQQDGATAQEVATARDYMTGVMPLVLQTAGEVADALMELFIHGLPDDWHARHRAAIAAVRADEIARVAGEHLHPAAAAIVVAGDAGGIVEDLNGLGIAPVQRPDLDWSA